MDTQYVLKKPIISEKSTKGSDKKKYTFAVDQKARKHDIKRAVEDKFKVNVISVSTWFIKGKKKRAGKLRKEITLSPIKKATVKLAKEQKIDIFSV